MSEEKENSRSTLVNREKTIVRTSMIAIATNLLLVAFKATVGFISNSIAIILDAINNLSDALSSVVTIIGARLGARQPDRKHPLGYGRVEYLSSMAVSILVLYAGITALIESIKKIISPEAASYGTASLIIMAVAIAAKILLGSYVKKQGEKVDSGALVASGSDALFDAVLSASVLVSALIYLFWGLSLEAYVGVIISGFIIKAGLEMLMETLNDIIGRREDTSTIRELKKIICEEKQVRGAYDVALFNYGPNRNYGAVHIELPDNLSVDDVDRIIRRVQHNVLEKTGIILTGISVYSYNTSDNEAAKMRNAVAKKVLEHDWALQIHGFYVDFEKKEIRFDTVISFDVDRLEVLEILHREISELYPGYEVYITPDIDVNDNLLPDD